jgi:hypothetical protein
MGWQSYIDMDWTHKLWQEVQPLIINRIQCKVETTSSKKTTPTASFTLRGRRANRPYFIGKSTTNTKFSGNQVIGLNRVRSFHGDRWTTLFDTTPWALQWNGLSSLSISIEATLFRYNPSLIRSLSRLDPSPVNYFDVTAISSLPMLKHLNIWVGSAPHTMAYSVLSLPSSATLQTLRVGCSEAATNVSHKSLCVRDMPKLEHFQVAPSFEVLIQPDAIWNSPLSSIDISCATIDTRIILTNASTSLVSFSSQAIESYDLGIIATYCPNVTSLNLSLLKYDAGLIRRITALTTLRELTLLTSPLILSDQEWCSLISLTRLEKLSIKEYGESKGQSSLAWSFSSAMYPLIYRMVMQRSPLLLLSTMPQSLSSSILPSLIKQTSSSSLPGTSSPLSTPNTETAPVTSTPVVTTSSIGSSSLESKEPMSSSSSSSSSSLSSSFSLTGYGPFEEGSVSFESSSPTTTTSQTNFMTMNDESISEWLYGIHHGKESRGICRMYRAHLRTAQYDPRFGNLGRFRVKSWHPVVLGWSASTSRNQERHKKELIRYANYRKKTLAAKEAYSRLLQQRMEALSSSSSSSSTNHRKSSGDDVISLAVIHHSIIDALVPSPGASWDQKEATSLSVSLADSNLFD